MPPFERLSNTMQKIWPLAILLGGLPIIPALISGQLAGSAYTDLFPAVWSLWAFAQEFPSLGHTELLNAPYGMGWYPQSLFSSILALPLVSILPLAVVYCICLWLPRTATLILTYKAAKSWGFSDNGALFAAFTFGCSPIFYGFAWEGIIEGVHVWTIPLWLWMVAEKRPLAIAVSFFLCILSSWYIAAVCCLILVLGIRVEKMPHSGWGLLMALPFVWLFFQAFPEIQQTPFTIRNSHSLSLVPPIPHFLQDSQVIFGQSNYFGWTLLGLLIAYGRRQMAWLIFPLCLGLGLPWLSDLPLLSSLRFPYRWQVGSLVIALYALAPYLRGKVPNWLPWLVLAEYTLLSPFSPVLPQTPLKTPDFPQTLNGPVLNIPTWIERAPGELNPSKLRAKAIYTAQFIHKQPIADAPHFNGLSNVDSAVPRSFFSFDPYGLNDNDKLSKMDLHTLEELDIEFILIHLPLLPEKRSERLQLELLELGMNPIHKTDDHILYQL
jgi:hypothetical protein